jgi:hypothetical protein
MAKEFFDLREALGHLKEAAPKISQGKAKGAITATGMRGKGMKKYDVSIKVVNGKLEFRIMDDTGKFQTVGIKQAAKMLGEEVQLEEAMNQKKFTAGAKAMKAYAQKNGGIDKKDFMEVSKLLDQIGRVNMLQAGQLLSRLNRIVDGMDTDVRERIFIELKKVGLVESVNEAKEPASPDEQSMAMRQANFILDVAEDLVEFIEDGDDFPEWMQNKVTALHEKAKDLYAALEGSDDEEEEVKESRYGTQSQRLMSPLQKARQDKEKRDRDRDGKLKSTALPMRKKEEVEEAVKFTDKQIKMAYGVANDKRYKGGNYSGAVRAIEKIAKGLSDHPAVKKVLKRTNENKVDESTAAYRKSQEKIANDRKKANIKPGELNKLAKIRAMLDREKKKK